MPQITITRKDLEAMSALAKKHGSKKFFMAKDQGAYVGVCGGDHDKGTFENHIVYFKGMDPKKNPYDFYDNARYAFGGDDFGEHFDIDIIHKLVADPLTTKMVVKVGRSSINISSYARKAPAAPKAAPKKAAPKPTTSKSTIGQIAMRGIENGMTNEAIISLVKSVYPDAKTSNASINWYRSKMRKAQS